MAPAQRVAVRQVELCGRQTPGLEQRAELEVDGVHVGVPAGKMAEAAVRIAATEGPVGTFLDRTPHRFRLPAQLPKDENRIETGVYVPVGFLDVPTAVRLLVAKHPLDHLCRLGRGLSDEAEVVGHVET